MWWRCEDEERSIPLQLERKVKANTQGKDHLLLLGVSRRLAIFRQLTYQIYYKWAQSCPLSGRCRFCHQAGHMARDCARAWDPLPSVPVDIDVPVDPDVDVSSASDSATVIEDPDPVDEPPDPEPTATIEDDRVPETVPVNNSSDPELPSVAVPPTVVPVSDKPPDTVPAKVTDKPPVADTVSVSDKPPVSPTADTAPAKVSDKVSDKPPVDDDVSMSKPVRSFVTAKVFCTRLSKTFDHLPFPSFSETSKDWDSKAKAHLRSQIKAAFSSKQLDLTTSDLRMWSDKDLRDVSNLLCDTLSVRDNLVDFVFGLVKSFWNNAKKIIFRFNHMYICIYIFGINF